MKRQRYTPGNAFPGTWDTVDEPIVVVGGVAFPSGVVEGLGRDHVRWLASQPRPEATCESRVTGAWMSNDIERAGLYACARDCFTAARLLAVGS